MKFAIQVKRVLTYTTEAIVEAENEAEARDLTQKQAGMGCFKWHSPSEEPLSGKISIIKVTHLPWE